MLPLLHIHKHIYNSPEQMGLCIHITYQIIFSLKFSLFEGLIMENHIVNIDIREYDANLSYLIKLISD